MDELEIAHILKHWAEPDANFREELLRRCLDELDCGDGCEELDDDALDLLSAAGDVFAEGMPSKTDGNTSWP